MGVNVYIVCVSGVSPWSSIGLGSGMQGASSCAAAFPWVFVLARSNNEGSLPAHLPAVPTRMTDSSLFLRAAGGVC